MSSIAISAQGTLIKLESATPGTYATIPEARKIAPPNVKFDLLDVTSHDSSGGFKEYIPGLSDGQNVTAEINFVPTNAIHTQLRTDSYARTKKLWKIIFAGAGTGGEIDFAAYITDLNPTADINSVLLETITGKVTGLPTWV